MKSLNVIRTHFSPYHEANFEQNERDRLQKIQGITMLPLEQADQESPSILITNTHSKLSQLSPKLLQHTKLIVHSNSGYDQFIQEAELVKDIPVVIGHEIRAQAVAEYCLGALWQALTELPQHLAWNKSRSWERPLIRNQEVWIFGYGHIGKIVAATLSALGAKVTLIDPYVKDIPFPLLGHWQKGNLTTARVVIACCSLNSSSLQLFNEDFFSNCHPELVFINGARGKLVQESALKSFLQAHSQAQAFLDVFEDEPFDESWHHFPQVWKTSHIAGVYSGLDEGIIQFEEKVLKDFINLKSSEFTKKYQLALLQNKWIRGELI